MNQKSRTVPYIVDREILRRFDRRKTVFRTTDGPWRKEEIDPLVTAEKRAVRWLERTARQAELPDVAGLAYAFQSPQDASNTVRAMALRLGAADVGITRLDPMWLYSHSHSGEVCQLPDGVNTVIVLAVRMDPEEVKKGGEAASLETYRGYANMAVLTHRLSVFLREMGYQGIPSGNDWGLSIPLAIDAGLGQMGRNGMLTSPKFGASLRICKVFTNLDMRCDEPIEVKLPCKKCRRCTESCPGDAISHSDEASYEVRGENNNPGVYRWPVDAQKCLDHWREKGDCCSECIANCPMLR